METTYQVVKIGRVVLHSTAKKNGRLFSIGNVVGGWSAAFLGLGGGVGVGGDFCYGHVAGAGVGVGVGVGFGDGAVGVVVLVLT